MERTGLKFLSREEALEFLRKELEDHGLKVDEKFLSKTVDII
jgi:hypothetical protein